jgi:hypothetical protein
MNSAVARIAARWITPEELSRVYGGKFEPKALAYFAKSGQIPCARLNSTSFRFCRDDIWSHDFQKALFEASDPRLRTTLATRMKRMDSQTGELICRACGTKECEPGRSPAFSFPYHHVVPLQFGGADDRKNLVLLCRKCHKSAHVQFPKGPEGEVGEGEYLKIVAGRTE